MLSDLTDEITNDKTKNIIKYSWLFPIEYPLDMTIL